MSDGRAVPELFAKRSFAAIPKLLTLQDRNPHSPTYGCFDRNYWHYRIIDFPSGMAQEFVWPLALAYGLRHPDNPVFQSAAVRDWIVAGLRFADRMSHRDGSTDDYFPFERATGASAFSLLACIESYALLDLADESLLEFFRKRAAWLARHREAGQLSNHEALVVTCLTRLSMIDPVSDGRWDADIEERLARLMSWQNEEGWFSEYGGCDPGYLTLTISLLAVLDDLLPRYELRQPIERAVRFAAAFVHPDGTFGGEYGSRNTLNFFGHGFELIGRDMPLALWINDSVLGGMQARRSPCYEDDHIIGHHLWNDLLAWRDAAPRLGQPVSADHPAQGRLHFPNAGLLVERRGNTEIFVGLNKGGVFKAFRNGALVAADTQLSFRVAEGSRLRTAVAHLLSDYDVTLQEDAIEVEGAFGWAKETRMTPLRLMLLRVVMLTVGRFFPNFIRKLLQGMLISGKKPAPFRFRRRFTWNGDDLTVEDDVASDHWAKVEQAGIGGHQTSIYVVMSRVFQSAQLQPWQDLTAQVRALKPGQKLEWQRKI